MMSATTWLGLRAALPNIPECRSIAAAVTSISSPTMPRSIVVIDGVSGSNMSVSQTSATSALSSSFAEARNGGRLLPPDSSSPSKHKVMLTGSVPVTGVCVDQQAALFAEACHTAGEAKCTYGTGAFMLACTGGTPTRSTNGLVGCPAWSLDSELTWCVDGQVYTAGAAVSWLIEMGIMQSPADLDALGGAVADSAGATFVPALAGLAAPYWKPNAKATFTGMSLGTQRGHLVRAAIDGIAAQVALLAHAAERDLGAPLTRLRVDGGLTRSHTLLQVQADLLQCPVEVYPSPHATALGVAAFAAIGAGQPLPSDTWQPSAIVEPSISGDEATARLATWQAVAEATLSL